MIARTGVRIRSASSNRLSPGRTVASRGVSGAGRPADRAALSGPADSRPRKPPTASSGGGGAPVIGCGR
jgi:hypothetical protein